MGKNGVSSAFTGGKMTRKVPFSTLFLCFFQNFVIFSSFFMFFPNFNEKWRKPNFRKNSRFLA
jgi:hypothetical protein